MGKNELLTIRYSSCNIVSLISFKPSLFDLFFRLGEQNVFTGWSHHFPVLSDTDQRVIAACKISHKTKLSHVCALGNNATELDRINAVTFINTNLEYQQYK